MPPQSLVADFDGDFTLLQGRLPDDCADLCSEHCLINALLPLLGGKEKADLVVNYIEKRAGLLIGQREKRSQPQLSFPHHTFQESPAEATSPTKITFQKSVCASPVVRLGTFENWTGCCSKKMNSAAYPGPLKLQ